MINKCTLTELLTYHFSLVFPRPPTYLRVHVHCLQIGDFITIFGNFLDPLATFLRQLVTNLAVVFQELCYWRLWKQCKYHGSLLVYCFQLAVRGAGSPFKALIKQRREWLPSVFIPKMSHTCTKPPLSSSNLNFHTKIVSHKNCCVILEQGHIDQRGLAVVRTVGGPYL